MPVFRWISDSVIIVNMDNSEIFHVSNVVTAMAHILITVKYTVIVFFVFYIVSCKKKKL